MFFILNFFKKNNHLNTKRAIIPGKNAAFDMEMELIYSLELRGK